MSKNYTSVLNLVKDVSDDKNFIKDFDTLINSRQITKTLFSLRCKANLSQVELAKKMNCTQGKISKIENSKDLDLSIDDLVKYCQAVNMKLEIGFSDLRMTMVDRVKYHYFMLKNLLEEMPELSGGDETINAGVEKFTKEAFVNISFGLLECVKKAMKTNESLAPLHVSTPINIENLIQESKSPESVIPV